MPNYHINQKTGNANICRAKDGNCPLKDADGNKVPHFDNKEQAQALVEQDLAQKHGSIKTLEKDNNNDDKQSDLEKQKPQDIKVSTYSPNFDVFNNLSHIVDYDYGYNEDYYSDTIDEDSIVINSIDEEELTKSIMDLDENSSISNDEKKKNFDELREILRTAGAFEPENYFGYTRGYDDNSKIYIKPKNDQLQKRIEQEYYKKPNAKDDKGILEYVRSKGQETEGLSPVEAIKKQLTNENNGRRSSLVDNATGVSKATLKIRDIRIGAKEHYENVKPLPMESNNTADKIAGVVVQTGTTYRLVDGYHRTKNLMNNKRILSQYIVLY